MAHISRPVGFVYDSEDMELSYYCMAIAKQAYKMIRKAKKSFERLFIVNMGDSRIVDPFFKDMITQTNYLTEANIIEKLRNCTKVLWFSKTLLIKPLSHLDDVIHYQFVRPMNWQQEDVKQSRLYDVSLIASQTVQRQMFCHLNTYEQYNFYPFYGNITSNADKHERETIIIDVMRTYSIDHYTKILKIILDLMPKSKKMVTLLVPQHLYKFNNKIINTLENIYSDRFIAVVQPSLDELFEIFKASQYYIDLNVNTSIGFFLCFAAQMNAIPISYDTRFICDVLNASTPMEQKIHLIPCTAVEDTKHIIQSVIPNYDKIKEKLFKVINTWSYEYVSEELKSRPNREAIVQDRMRKYLRVLSSIVQEEYCLLYPRSQCLIDSLPQRNQKVTVLPGSYYTSSEY
jgi:hypothetical protein